MTDTLKPADMSLGSSFLFKLASYSLVKLSCQTTIHYYNEAKAKSPLVKRGLELAETSALLVVSAEPVQKAAHYCKPLLEKADEFGCHQLDKIDEKVLKPADDLRCKANEGLARGKRLVEEHLVEPVSSTYANLKALPNALINYAFDFADSSIDYYLPEESSLGSDEVSLPDQTETASEAAQEESVSDQKVPLTTVVWSRGVRVGRKASRRIKQRAAYRYSQLNSSHKLYTAVPLLARAVAGVQAAASTLSLAVRYHDKKYQLQKVARVWVEKRAQEGAAVRAALRARLEAALTRVQAVISKLKPTSTSTTSSSSSRQTETQKPSTSTNSYQAFTQGTNVQGEGQKTETILLPPFIPAPGHDSEEEVEFQHEEEEEQEDEEDDGDIYPEPCTTAF